MRGLSAMQEQMAALNGQIAMANLLVERIQELEGQVAGIPALDAAIVCR